MKRLLQKSLWLVFMPIMLLIGAYGSGWTKGVNDGYKDFQLEKCWIQEPSRDIVCVVTIADL